MTTFAEMQATATQTAPVSGSPFGGSPFGQPAGMALQPGADLFGQPDTAPAGGKFTKVHSLEGQLVLVAPQRIEMVQKYDKTGDEEALIATLVILTGPSAGTEVETWQVTAAKFVRLGKAALGKHQQYVLGRVGKVPTWDAVKAGSFKEDDSVGINKARQEWAMAGANPGSEPKYAWSLLRFTEEDAKIATAYLTK